MSQKWSYLRGKYENTPLGAMSDAHNPNYVARVEELKAEFGELPQVDLINAHAVETETKHELEKKMTETNARLEAISQLLIDHFHAAGVTSVNTEKGRTLYISSEPYVSVEDKDEWYKFVRNREELAYMWMTHGSSVTSWVKSLIEEGKDMEIPECLKVMLKSSIRSR